jgi:hypothetical protein
MAPPPGPGTIVSGMTSPEPTRQSFLRSRNGRVALLVALLVDIFIVPLLMSKGTLPVRAGDVFFAAVMLVAMSALGRGRARSWAMGLALAAFLAQFLRFFGSGPTGAIVDALLSAATLGLFAALVLVDTLQGDPVVDRLLDVVLAYVLLGATFALLYEVVDTAAPGALSLLPSRRDDFEYVYFSMTTMTSVGSGTVVPVSRVARLLVMVESLMGQLYVAVLVARFVSLGASRPRPTGAR